MRGFGVLAGTVLLAAASTAPAQHGPHVHGQGELNVAVEGDTVIIELIAPGSDIVGFEHAPETDADRAAVAAAAGKLEDGERIFAFPKAAGCRLEEAEVESELMDGDGHGDEHSEEHAHEHADKHSDEHSEEGHAEFHAHYRFRCSAPAALDSVDVRYFATFSRAEELDARIITSRGQGAAELTPAAPRLAF